MSTQRRGIAADFWIRSRARFVAVALATLALTVPFLAPAAANAAGNGVVSVTIEPVHYLTPSIPQTTAAYGTFGDKVGYRISFSCATDTCVNTTIRLTPPQQDPYGLAAQAPSYVPIKTLLAYTSWTAPSGAATISGDDVTGKLINLGDLTAGQSGSFVVAYMIEGSGTYTTARAAQFYPDGFQIRNAATIDSPSAVGPVTSSASPVTWNIDVPTPSMTIGNPGTVKPDTSVTYRVNMNSGAFIRRDAGSIVGISAWQAAGSFVVVDKLPAKAVYVASSGGGAYDAATHTVTWTTGSVAAPNYGAAGGWGWATDSGWTVRGSYGPRTVTVQYPAANFTNVDGCEFDEDVTNNTTATLTYLDTARTVKSTTASTTHSVSCYTPFARASQSKVSSRDNSSGLSYINVPPVVAGVNCPPSGTDQWGRLCTPGQPVAAFGNNLKYWEINSYNEGNVPAVAVVTDNSLDLAGAPVYRMASSSAATFEWSYQCTTGGVVTGTSAAITALALTTAQQNAGCRYVTARITSGPIAPRNIKPAQVGGTAFTVVFNYSVSNVAVPFIGQTRTNTALLNMSFPGYSDAAGAPLADIARTSSREIIFRAMPTSTLKPGFAAAFPLPAAVAGGSNAVPGRDVTFSVNGTTANIPADEDITPQYVFIAPTGWAVTKNSASFSAAVPAGVQFAYTTKTIDGVERQAVVATWPSTVVFGENSTWPTMTIVAQPTFAVRGGTTSVASAWMGDSRHTWDNTAANYAGAVQDTADVDGDLTENEWFASANQNVVVSSFTFASVKKEICLLIAGVCTWIGDANQVVPVSTTASNIRYRVTIQNTGNADLTNVVAYDVLPYVGDTGLIDSTAGTSRGSTFNETLASVSDVSANVALSYSAETNPSRPEVFTGATSPGAWNATAAGKAAIRAQVVGPLAPGQTASFTYSANVGSGAMADAKACNSVAVDTGETLPSEPPAVCATTAEADLEISVPDRLPLQAGRPGVVPFTVTNHGGSLNAPGIVTIALPSGLSATSLTPAGWSCTAASGTLPIAGPASLNCAPVDASGNPRTITKDIADTISLPVTAAAAMPNVCVDAEVDGAMHDTVTTNNETTGCMSVLAGTPTLSVAKDDARTSVAIGETTTYTITTSNALVGEALADIVLTDKLPAGVQFVSASDGGTESGGVVTWPTFTLDAAGTVSSGGNSAAVAPGSSTTRTVSVIVTHEASTSLTNSATALAPDPANSAADLSGTGTDVDTLRKSAITKTSNASAIGVLSGDEVTYTVTLTNAGTAAYTAGAPAAIRDVLAAVLDDTTFVTGSASVAVNGAAAQAVTPTAGVLSWSGALPVGQSAVLTYRVLVGDGATGDRQLVNTAYSSATGAACIAATGLDASGFACVQTTIPFAPTFSKSIVSSEQQANGSWRIVYGLDVVNLNSAAAVTYGVTDSLGFGVGIPIANASVSMAPAGVTTSAWTGTGALASAVSLPAGATHHYELTVVTAQFVPGTSAVCVANAPGGFGNTATLTPVGGVTTTKWACAQPSMPTVEKSVATPVQNADGTWDVTYTITVAAPTDAPAAGLAYTLRDALAFPAGVDVRRVSASGPSGAAVSPAFDGRTTTDLLSTPDRVTPGTPRVFTVVATTDVPAGSVTGGDLACPPAEGGYANAVTLLSGSSNTVLGTASACAQITAQPTPTVAKTVAAASINPVTGEWTINYAVTVTNPSSTLSTRYSLGDQLQFGTGITIVGIPDITSTSATPSEAWNGTTVTSVIVDEPLPAGAVHSYSVTVVANTVTVTDANVSDMDCALTSGETGTGFRNVATVNSGVAAPVFAVGCTAANDPSVVKTIAQTPVQDPDTGVWTVVYEITVTNRATAPVVGDYPYELNDTFRFPAGTVVVGPVTVDAPSGITPNASFNGGTSTRIATATILSAPNDTTPSTHVYRVTVNYTVPAGLNAVQQRCDPAQGPGGMGNEAEVKIGARATSDVACVDAPDVPIAGVAKEVLGQTQQADGTWVVRYRVTVANPDPTISTVYDLEDKFALGAGISLVGTPTVIAHPAGVTIDSAWNGAASTTVVDNIVLGGGVSHQYTLRATIDARAVRATDAAGDCTLTSSETGTGFMNAAIASTGTVTRSNSACATAFDPAVSKTLNGAPVLNADGTWTLAYVLSVRNPSATTALSYGLNDAFAFPAGTVFGDTTVAARAGGPATSSNWDGVNDVVVVAGGAALLGGATHVFDVRVTVTLDAAQQSVANGWINSATVWSSTGGAVSDQATVLTDIALPKLVISKSSNAGAVMRIGDTVDYTITAENVGVGNFTPVFPAEVWDYLEGALDDATFDNTAAATGGLGTFAFASDRFSWTGALLAGDTVELTYSVVVTAEGDKDLRNLAFAPALPGTAPSAPLTCDPDVCDEVSTALPAFLLEKRASTGVAAIGDGVTYTITYSNTGAVDVTGATFTDDLSDVRDDATVATPTASVGVATVSGNTLSWTGDLLAGESVTVTYKATVTDPLAGNAFLTNTVTADPDFGMGWAGGTCPSGTGPCALPDRVVSVGTAIRALAFTKTADASRTTVGEKVSYTITVTNIGTDDFTTTDPASVVDNLSGVLDDARYNGDAVAASGAISFLAPTLGWSGALAAGDSVTVKFSVTVNNQLGDAQLVNVIGLASSTTAADACAADPSDNAAEDCFVSTLIQPLAVTGGVVSLIPWLVALLLIVLGALGVVFDRRRRKLTA